MEKLLKPQDVADWLSVSVKTLYSWSYLGKGPRVLKIEGALRYRRLDVERWLDERSSASAAA